MSAFPAAPADHPINRPKPDGPVFHPAPADANTNRLGDTQMSFLRSVYEHQFTYRSGGSGWSWGTSSVHQRLVESLHKRGLLTLTQHGTRRLNWPIERRGEMGPAPDMDRFELTDVGFEVIRPDVEAREARRAEAAAAREAEAARREQADRRLAELIDEANALVPGEPFTKGLDVARIDVDGLQSLVRFIAERIA